MKKWYSAQELVDLNLDSLPKSKSNVIIRAKKDNWEHRKRSGKGGGVEYAFDGLPKDVQTEIRGKELIRAVRGDKKERISTGERALIATGRDTATFSDHQRNVADARVQMALFVISHGIKHHLNRTDAIKAVSKLSRMGQLPMADGVDYNRVCQKALARKPKNTQGVGTRKLHEWVLSVENTHTGEQNLQVFAPNKQGRPEINACHVPWLPDFMSVYRNTNGVCISEAYRAFRYGYQAKQATEPMTYELPSENQVRLVLAKIPNHILQIGRKTGANLRALKTYVKRDWSVLKANDVWVGDGHSLKMKVAHPDHGRPMTPELTLIMDTASRYIVGWSLAYSENTFAVADALRHGMIHHGIPAVYYSDNGGGQKNHTLDADITGILPRLGINHQTGIPGNPQGRGIIERVMQTLAHPIARAFPTYFGKGADKDTVRQVLTATDSLAKAQTDIKKIGKELTAKQKSAVGKLPHWTELLAVIQQAVDWYNHEHEHSELGGATPAMVREYLLGQLDEGELIGLTEAEARDMFRPSVIRTVERAWLSVYNNEYWHKELENYDGKKVQVCIDQHDPKTVIIRDLDGKYICEAVLDGNKKDAFPLSLIQKSKKERVKRVLTKSEDKVAQAKLELRETIQVDNLNSMGELGGYFALQTAQKEEDDEDFVLYEHELQRKVV